MGIPIARLGMTADFYKRSPILRRVHLDDDARAALARFRSDVLHALARLRHELDLVGSLAQIEDRDSGLAGQPNCRSLLSSRCRGTIHPCIRHAPGRTSKPAPRAR